MTKWNFFFPYMMMEAQWWTRLYSIVLTGYLNAKYMVLLLYLLSTYVVFAVYLYNVYWVFMLYPLGLYMVPEYSNM